GACCRVQACSSGPPGGVVGLVVHPYRLEQGLELIGLVPRAPPMRRGTAGPSKPGAAQKNYTAPVRQGPATGPLSPSPTVITVTTLLLWQRTNARSTAWGKVPARRRPR